MDNFLIFLGLQLIRDGMPPPVALVLSVLFFFQRDALFAFFVIMGQIIEE